MTWLIVAVAIRLIVVLIVLGMIIRGQRKRADRTRAEVDRELRATMILLEQDEIIGRLLHEKPFEGRRRD